MDKHQELIRIPLWILDPCADGGYEIVWRQTDEPDNFYWNSGPLWAHVIPVGQTNSATVLLSKGNVQIGIRAVGSTSFRSQATFPLLPSAYNQPILEYLRGNGIFYTVRIANIR